MVHTDGLDATLNIVKRLMTVSKGISQGGSVTSNVPFMITSGDNM